MKKISLTLCFFGFLSLQGFSQNQINLGQYMIHQPFINPAATGSFQNITLAGFYKAQWTKFNGAPVIQGFNAILPFGNKKQAFGISAIHDAIGINNNSEISLSYSYRAKVAVNSYLVFGLGASVDLMQSDYNQLHTITPDDPLFQSNSPLVPLPDFKFGLYFFRNRFYAGFALPNMLNNRVTFTTSGASVGSTQWFCTKSSMGFECFHFIETSKWCSFAS
jgi:type IX secretion system PorP/SprF family membrane protein